MLKFRSTAPSHPEFDDDDIRYVNFFAEQLQYIIEIGFPKSIHFNMNKDIIAETEALALEWIAENVECHWSLEMVFDRIMDKWHPILRYSFSDLSTAALFRLKF